MKICENPDILTAMLVINKIVLILKVLVPVLLIIVTIISLFRTTIDSDNYKDAIILFLSRVIIAAFIFFIPSFVEAVFSFVPVDLGYQDCFDNATPEKIKMYMVKSAVSLVKKAEETLTYTTYKDALYTVNRLDEEPTKTNLLNRLDAVKTLLDDEVKKRLAKGSNDHPIGGGGDTGDPLNPGGGGQSTGGNGACSQGVVYSSEPDPSSPINCYPGIVNSKNFIYPKDSATGLPLGAWPINYQSIPTQLSGYKVHNNYFVFPTTPVNGTYNFVYDHNGMDIMAVFGTPIYSPVDGTLVYSEWGHTCNKGADETAYTVSIKMSTPTTFNGKTIDTVFMTHMSGIVYRCAPGTCNRTIKKGQLIGFTGNAAGTAESSGWAPHLHITLYGNSCYDCGLKTNDTERVFDLPVGTSGYSIKAGE